MDGDGYLVTAPTPAPVSAVCSPPATCRTRSPPGGDGSRQRLHGGARGERYLAEQDEPTAAATSGRPARRRHQAGAPSDDRLGPGADFTDLLAASPRADRLGLSQSAISRQIGVSQQTISPAHRCSTAWGVRLADADRAGRDPARDRQRGGAQRSPRSRRCSARCATRWRPSSRQYHGWTVWPHLYGFRERYPDITLSS